MTEQTFTFTAAQIRIICETARDAAREDFTWDAAHGTFAQVRDMVNAGKPEAEQVSRETFFGWFGVEPPAWVK
jgi:glycerol-3-phosphate dehydrogenase